MRGPDAPRPGRPQTNGSGTVILVDLEGVGLVVGGSVTDTPRPLQCSQPPKYGRTASPSVSRSHHSPSKNYSTELDGLERDGRRSPVPTFLFSDDFNVRPVDREALGTPTYHEDSSVDDNPTNQGRSSAG